MTSAFDAHLRYLAFFYQILDSINNAYLQGGPRLQRVLFFFDLNRANIEKSQAWAAENMGKHKLATEVCMRIAVKQILELRQQPDQRIEWLEAGIDASDVLMHAIGKANMIAGLGLEYFKKGYLDKAISHYQKAVNIFVSNSDRRGEAGILGNIGAAYRAKGNSQKAIEYCEQALFINKELDDRRGAGINSLNLGIAYMDVGNYEKAFLYYEQSFNIAREIGDRTAEGPALAGIGGLYQLMGDYQRSLNYLHAALAIAREFKHRQLEIAAFGQIGINLHMLGQTDKALEYYLLELNLARENQDIRREAGAIMTIGVIHIQRGHNIDETIEQYQIQLERLQATGNNRGVGMISLLLAMCYGMKGDIGRCISVAENAFQILGKVDDTFAKILKENFEKFVREEL